MQVGGQNKRNEVSAGELNIARLDAGGIASGSAVSAVDNHAVVQYDRLAQPVRCDVVYQRVEFCPGQARK